MIELKNKYGLVKRSFATTALPSGEQDYWIPVALHDTKYKLVEKIEVAATESEDYAEAYKKALASHAQLRTHLLREIKEKKGLFTPSLENDLFAAAVDDWETYRKICRPEESKKVDFMRNGINSDITRKLAPMISAFEEDTKKLERVLTEKLRRIATAHPGYEIIIRKIEEGKSEKDLAEGHAIGIVLKDEDPHDADVRGTLTQLGTVKSAQLYLNEKKKLILDQIKHNHPHKESAVSEGQHLVEFVVNLYRAYGYPAFQGAVSIMDMSSPNPSTFARGITALFAKPIGYPLKRQDDPDYPFFAEGVSVNVPRIGPMPVVFPIVDLENHEHLVLNEEGEPYPKDKEEFTLMLEREIKEARNSRKKGFYLDQLKEEYGVR